MSIKSLIINPGSTSTKIGVFEDETLLFEETLRHSTEEIAQYASIVDQKDFRKKIIMDLLTEKDFEALGVCKYMGEHYVESEMDEYEEEEQRNITNLIG